MLLGRPAFASLDHQIEPLRIGRIASHLQDGSLPGKLRHNLPILIDRLKQLRFALGVLPSRNEPASDAEQYGNKKGGQAISADVDTPGQPKFSGYLLGMVGRAGT